MIHTVVHSLLLVEVATLQYESLAILHTRLVTTT